MTLLNLDRLLRLGDTKYMVIQGELRVVIRGKKANYYTREVLLLLKQHKVMKFTHTYSRLANNDLPNSIQRLRCQDNYEALRYAKEIEDLGRTLADRLKSDNGPYIA
ncbi:hypothetical protein ERO13_D03G038650v2 [Gossypium hirsutum]|nr:hypothetical protein ERO13_D03G038650v2 [Gossypium hirsutum]